MQRDAPNAVQGQAQHREGAGMKLFTSLKGRLQSVGATVRQYRSTAVVPALVFAALTAIGVAVVIIASNSQVDTNKRQATLDAAAAAELMTQVIHGMMQPIYSMARFIQARPYYPTVVQQFPSLTKALLEQVDNLNSSSYVQLGPMASILHVYPENANSVKSVGLDLLNYSATLQQTLNNLRQPRDKRLTLIGPITLYGERIWAMVGTAVIFVSNVTSNETFGMPSSLPTECPPILGSLCYDEATKSKLWGLICSIIYFDSFVTGPSAALDSLREKGYNYLLVQKSMDLPPTPGVTGPDGHNVTVLARTAGALSSDPVLATIDVDSVSLFTPWTLMLTTSSGWEPSWKVPLLVTVVVVAAIIGVLMFMLLLYMRQHQMLLFAVVPQKVVQSMFQGDAFESIVRGQDLSSSGVQMLGAGTPVERLMDILSQFMMGKSPQIQDVVALRAAIMHGGDVLFEPQNLKGQLQLNRDLPDDVVDALLRQLQGSTAGAGDAEPRLTLDPGCLPDDVSATGLTAALALIMKHPAGQLECSPSVDSFNSFRRSAQRNGSASALGGKGGGGGSRGSRSSAPCLQRSPSEEDASGCSPVMHVLLREGAGATAKSAAAQGGGQAPDKLLNPQPSPSNQVEQLLEAGYGSWDFNAFELSEATCGHPLSVMFFFLLVRSGLMKDMKLNPSTVARLALALEDGYQPNPYHNKTHAADVLQTMHTILVHTGMVVAVGQKGYCPPETLLACLLAAAGHDVGHSGVTNDFLIHSEDLLSTLYSDRSPMENHHLAQLWTLLRNPGLNILAGLSKEERAKIRKTVIELVSATDMKTHFSMLSQFSVMHHLNGNNAPGGIGRSSGAPHTSAAASNAATRHTVSSALQCLPKDDAEQMLSLQIVLKCADLGHIAEETEVHCRWVGCLEEEFFAQGDRERSLGLPISPLFDRNKPGASKSQIGFYDFVVLPLFHNFSCAFPGAKPMVDLALVTYRYWKSMSQPAEAG